MDDIKKKNSADSDKEIVFSRSVKAGKRIYYLDVKKNRKDEMYLAITESKKVIQGEGSEAQVSFEKHKIFLYKEDFEKFIVGLTEAVKFIENEQEPHPEEPQKQTEQKETETKEEIPQTSPDQTTDEKKDEGPIKLDIEF